MEQKKNIFIKPSNFLNKNLNKYQLSHPRIFPLGGCGPNDDRKRKLGLRNWGTAILRQSKIAQQCKGFGFMLYNELASKAVMKSAAIQLNMKQNNSAKVDVASITKDELEAYIEICDKKTIDNKTGLNENQNKVITNKLYKISGTIKKSLKSHPLSNEHQFYLRRKLEMLTQTQLGKKDIK